MGSMLQMMENMMDGGTDKGEGKQPGEGEGKKAGENGGGGDAKNGGSATGKAGNPDNTAENTERRVPKNSGNTGSTLPKEFQKAMDAYNKGASTQP